MTISAIPPAAAAAVAPAAPAAAPARNALAPDFGTLLADVAKDAVGALRQGEAAAIAGLQEKASLQRVVEALMAAETTLHTALAVRDKAVAAWQDVSRMQI